MSENTNGILRGYGMENEIVLRNAREGDVKQIAEICVEDWQKAYRGIMDGEYLDSLSVDARCEIERKRYQKLVVAARGDEILGYAWSETGADEDADCEIVALYVRYGLRKNGIGKRLLACAMERFKALGKKKMILWCLKDNAEARAFYEKTGGKQGKTALHNWGGKDYAIVSYLYDLT